MSARIYGISPSAIARVLRAVNQHSDWPRAGQPKNSVVGYRAYLESRWIWRLRSRTGFKTRMLGRGEAG